MSNSPFQTVLRELELRVEDIRPSDIVLFSEPLRSALNFTVRVGRFSLTEFTGILEFTREEAKKIADLLVERNLFDVYRIIAEEVYYEARISGATRPLKRPPSDIWKKLD
jgi:hypothetical protein